MALQKPPANAPMIAAYGLLSPEWLLWLTSVADAIAVLQIPAGVPALATVATRLETPRLINGIAFDGSADITLTPAAVNPLPTTILNEAPVGTIDGANLVYTTVASFLTGSTRLYLNGVRQALGVDYTETGARQLTMTVAPIVGDVLAVDYET